MNRFMHNDKRHPLVCGAPKRPSSRAHARRERGSLLVLVIVSLVLMVLLGTAYLQVARVDRFATADIHQNNIEQVKNAVINYIGVVLRNDLVSKDSSFFKRAAAAPSILDLQQGTGDEAYDYPWTSNLTLWQISIDPDSINTDTTNANGGLYDDTWLASTFPTITTGTLDATWSHITNLMGSYLRLPANGSAVKFPEEEPTKIADIAMRWRNDTNVPISHTYAGGMQLDDTNSGNSQLLGIDTDQDGILDAKWQWAPLRQIGSTKYVMAVRIIDNSSMINLNTASSMTTDGSTASATARGNFPTEIDLSRIVARMPSVRPIAGAGAYWYDELVTNTTTPESLFFNRGLSTAAPLTPYGTPTITAGQVTWPAVSTNVAGSWLDNVRLWGNPLNKLATANEMELRRLGGVNKDSVNTAIEDAMPTLLRRNSAGEVDYRSMAYPGALTDLQKRMAFFQGIDTGDASNSASAVGNRQFPSLRNQFTTHSAAAVFASNTGDVNLASLGAGNPVHTLKYDLVHGDGGNTKNNGPRLQALYDRLLTILSISDNGPWVAGPNAYLGLNTGVAMDAATLSDIAFEYALAIQDYSDADRAPSRVTPAVSSVAGRTYYSLETLPFFREVYVQAAYQDIDTNTDSIPDTFVYDGNSMALAYEIGNPFDRTIDFDAAGEPAIRVKVGPNLYPLTGNLTTRQTRVFYANTILADRRAEGPEPQARGDLLMDLSLTAGANVVALPEGPTHPAASQIVFELQVEASPGVWVTYDRMTSSPTDTPMEFYASNNHNDPAATIAELNLYHFMIFNVARPCTLTGTPDIYYISNHNKQLFDYQPQTTRIAFQANNSKFGVDDKALLGEGDPQLTNYQLPMANRQFMNIAELGWIHMFGFYTNSGNAADDFVGDFPARMALLPANRRRLEITSPTVPTYAGMNMPHGALLFEQFTTLSPRNDGEDNDNDGVVDNIAEQAVHGQININTASEHVLTLAASMNENITDIESLVKTILYYRDNPIDRAAMNAAVPATARTEPGLASIGELMLMDNASFQNIPAGVDMTQPQARIDGYTTILPATFAGTNIDLYPMPEEAATRHPARADGAEARLARFQFISQVFNTRSDTFTAFVRLRGYPAQDFSKGEVESSNFLVVYDRSNIVSASDMPRIVGVYVYNVP